MSEKLTQQDLETAEPLQAEISAQAHDAVDELFEEFPPKKGSYSERTREDVMRDTQAIHRARNGRLAAKILRRQVTRGLY